MEALVLKRGVHCANRSDCCRPLCLELMHVVYTRYSFLGNTVVELERSHPDAIARMLLVSQTIVSVNSDGVGISPSTGKVRLTACCSSSRPYGRTLTHAFVSSGRLPAVADGGPHTCLCQHHACSGDSGRLLHCLLRSDHIPVTAARARAALGHHGHHRRRADVLDCGEVIETTSRPCYCRSAGGWRASCELTRPLLRYMASHIVATARIEV